jgi:hypothetical protein
MKGYRDEFFIDTDAIIELISAIEVRTHNSAAEAARVNEEIRIASKSTTHMCVPFPYICLSDETYLLTCIP